MEPQSDEELEALLARSRKQPLSFAFGLGREPEESVFMMHRKQTPDRLYKSLRMPQRCHVERRVWRGLVRRSHRHTHMRENALRAQTLVKLLFKSKGMSWKAKVVEGEENTN